MADRFAPRTNQSHLIEVLESCWITGLLLKSIRDPHKTEADVFNSHRARLSLWRTIKHQSIDDDDFIQSVCEAVASEQKQGLHNVINEMNEWFEEEKERYEDTTVRYGKKWKTWYDGLNKWLDEQDLPSREARIDRIRDYSIPEPTKPAPPRRPLPESLEKAARMMATIRNRLCHEWDYTHVDNIQSFRDACSQLKTHLIAEALRVSKGQNRYMSFDVSQCRKDDPSLSIENGYPNDEKDWTVFDFCRAAVEINKDQYADFTLVIDATKAIEWHLSRCFQTSSYYDYGHDEGEGGAGLIQLLDRCETLLHADIIELIRELASLRNQVMYYAVVLTPDERDRYITAVTNIIGTFKTTDGTLAPVERINVPLTQCVIQNDEISLAIVGKSAPIEGGEWIGCLVVVAMTFAVVAFLALGFYWVVF